ncbi:MAG: elongation factor G, partial [Oscillospiraceae bacterium]|nr:elongation factor G [Oscillospiraceae bacterium]
MSAKDVRNIVLLGHGGSGKTTLAEAMLAMAGASAQLDYDAEEKKRGISIALSTAPATWKNVKINILDAPGNFDFAGEALSGLRAAECAVLVCGAKDGLSVGAERAWKMLGKKPRMIFINRTDEDNSNYQTCFDALKGKFGAAVAPIVAPVTDGAGHVTAIVDLLHNKAYEVKGGKAAACAIPDSVKDEVDSLRAELMEAAAGADEELMEKFFETMELSSEDIAKGLKLGVHDGSVAPVLCGSAANGLGVEMLLETVLDLVPVATDMPAEQAKTEDGKDVEVAYDENGATAAIVFKTISDQYGKYSLVKVVRGKITGDMSLYDPTTGNTEKLGRLYAIKGQKNEEVKEIGCGDIGAIAKMDRVKTGDTLCDAKSVVVLKGIDFAEPCYSRAIAPKTRGQEDKLGTGLNRLNEEDPTFTVNNNAETHQIVVSGAGDIQIDVLVSKLKSRFGV